MSDHWRYTNSYGYRTRPSDVRAKRYGSGRYFDY